MSDHLYVLRLNHMSGQTMYYTTYVKERTRFIVSPNKTNIEMLRGTVLHHHDTKRTWINRGVFYRSSHDRNTHDTIHVTDHDKNTLVKSLDFMLYNTPPTQADDDDDEPPPPLLDVVALSLGNQRDMDEVRRMSCFANTSLFLLDDYEYTQRTSHLALKGFTIELPEEDHAEWPRGPQAYNIEFLNSLWSL
jgi:hypothetical protein